jgi:prepilin-type N-terminal cleavage/methylation domain-containing protein
MTDPERARQDRSARGFTLAELMVSMSIGTIILLVVLSVVASGGDGYDTATRRVDANVEARSALTALADDSASLRVDGNLVLEDLNGAWAGSEISFLTLKPRSAQDSSEASGDLCFVHYYTAVTQQLEGNTGPFSRKLYRRLVSSGPVMKTLKDGGDFTSPNKDPKRREDEAIAFNVVQFLVKAMVELEDGTLEEWNRLDNEPDFLDVTLRVTDNKTAALLSAAGDWESGSGLAEQMLGSEADPESGKRLRTYHIVIPVL